MQNVIALLTKDQYERLHIKFMQYIGLMFSEYIHLSQKHTCQLNNAIILHDIGKVILDPNIISKPNKLTPREYELIQNHSFLGYWLTKSLYMPESIALTILHHHEKWDGTGYPYKLYGAQIPYLSRIITLIDSYEAMSDHRPYKPLMSKEQIIDEIKRGSNHQFDPILANDFINFLVINNFPCHHSNDNYIECCE
jgi:HD-GYP domain-containing protein (c-di-GMP phosphodiesterase class II)